jgi:branched-chain amino acid transport system ATP-binding protein
MNVLTVKDLNVVYGDVQILWDVSFSVGEGEIVALIGSNGAGKTSTLRAISGIVPVKSGEILLRDEPIQKKRAHHIARMGLAHIPEGRELFSELTVQDNIRLGGQYTVRDRKEEMRTMDEVFGLFPRLADRKNQVAGNLSGGEQQMLAIARGLMSKPRILMLDEPSLGLAPIIVSELFSLIREINKKGVTILLVEQNVNKTLEICDRAYVLETGTIVLEGKGSELQMNGQIRKAYLGL